ncbi:hypothetical protein [Pedosphaera parvula]|uniref:Uncharacterized protein n=1 Tax=Pedosphaera parvula (strain Ellin514) TaxID=320771 RepID=B9XNT3_PEDPL|nr:hypothetical protein [Pedosphaera parvula]EEF58506.1 hypothetical protein Cflav_PD1233 [Pedosphaera parvula Ellin514]
MHVQIVILSKFQIGDGLAFAVRNISYGAEAIGRYRKVSEGIGRYRKVKIFPGGMMPLGKEMERLNVTSNELIGGGSVITMGCQSAVAKIDEADWVGGVTEVAEEVKIGFEGQKGVGKSVEILISERLQSFRRQSMLAG